MIHINMGIKQTQNLCVGVLYIYPSPVPFGPDLNLPTPNHFSDYDVTGSDLIFDKIVGNTL